MDGKYKLGDIEIYQSRSASLVIDEYATKPSDNIISVRQILDHAQLREPHLCIPGPGPCQPPKDLTFLGDSVGGKFEEMKDDLSTHEDIPAKDGKPGSPAKGVENWRKIFIACKKIRDESAKFGLSTVDALLVRWALLEDAGLLQVIKDYQDTSEPSIRIDGGGEAAPPPPSDTSAAYAAAIRRVAVLGHDRPDALCWAPRTKEAPGDTARLKAVTEATEITLAK